MLKKPATYRDQIEALRRHGCAIEDEAFCEDVLSKISYYRLSAYFLPFRTPSGTYKAGTSFAKVYALYEFDRKLRHLVFSATGELEIFLRSQLSYYHAHKYGSDGYLNPTNFNSRHNHERFVVRINEVIDGNSKAAFVSHHLTKYDGRFPLWALTELFTFGMLSYFYADMHTADQKRIAHDILGVTVPEAKSWLYCCTYLRNLCAHYGRLYFRVFGAAPAPIAGVKSSDKRSLFAAIMALRALYPDRDKWNGEFLVPLTALFDEYSDVIELKHIGFPQDWEGIIRK